MSKKSEDLKTRSERLDLAVQSACLRLKDTSSALSVVVITRLSAGVSIGKYEDSKAATARVVVASDEELCVSFRVGQTPKDDFFELKLVPSLHTLAIALDDFDQDSATFVVGHAIELVHVYNGHEINAIIRLLNALS